MHVLFAKKGTRERGVERGEQEREARGRNSYLQPESGHLVPDQGGQKQ